MSTIDLLETDIVGRIATALTLPGQTQPKVDVVVWSEQGHVNLMAHPGGCVMVMHKGSRFAQKPNLRSGLVPYEIAFELHLLSHLLRESPSAQSVDDAAAGSSIYELLDDCKQALLGWQPEQAVGSIRLCADKLGRCGHDTWRYQLLFAVPMLRVATQHCPLGPWVYEGLNSCCVSAPPLTQVNFVHF